MILKKTSNTASINQMLEHNKCITTQFNRLRQLKKDSGYINI